MADESEGVPAAGWGARSRRAASWVRAHPQLAAWVACAVGLGVYLIAVGPTAADARADWYHYWGLRESYGRPFSLFNYSNPLRGYSYPLLLRGLADGLWFTTPSHDVTARLISWALLPALVCGVVPALARRVSATARVTAPRLIVLFVLFCLFWRGDLLVPLTDLPALFLTAAAVLLLVLDRRRLAAGVAAGACLGLALNMRPAYLLTAVVLVLFAAARERGMAAVGRRFAALVVGLLIAVGPQVAINVHNGAGASAFPPSSSDLTLLQLYTGISMTRYDTYVGSDRRFANGQMIYVNDDLVPQLGGVFGRFSSFGDYLRFAGSHPAGVSSVYARHLFNGLDVRRGGTYAYDLSQGDPVLPVVNFAVLAVAIVVLARRRWRGGRVRWRSPATLVTAVVLATCIPAVTGAVEVRFLLPLHLTLMSVVTLSLSRSDLPRRAWSRAAVGAAVVAIVVVLSLLSARTMSQLVPVPLTFAGTVSSP